ncbi:hypothetical protein DH2020_037017 [Rehmannia glutinosa]|uniref:U1-type domain-containing protein n=1 Tax=Rehmannia glutinosa TaxID=99300 RepID=A0ABR0V279_REHGL
MDYATEMQQNPNPNSDLSHLHTINYSNNYYYNHISDRYQPTSVDPNAALYLHQPQPPGVDPPYVPAPANVQYAQYPTPPVNVQYAQHPPPSETVQYAQHPPAPVTVQYAQHPVSFEPQQGVASAAYYGDPNASWQAAINQFGATPYAAGVATSNPAIQPQRRNTWKKGPKKTKVVQSAWCEVCKIDCNSKGVLDQHKLGKKHLKNLEKLKAQFTYVPPPANVAASTPLPVPASVPIHKPIIGPEDNPEKPKISNSQKARKKAAAARTEDIETKRRKVLEGGADASAVRLCSICNVVCNSNTVFNYHLAGQKHASMVKKYASSAGAASVM